VSRARQFREGEDGERFGAVGLDLAARRLELGGESTKKVAVTRASCSPLKTAGGACGTGPSSAVGASRLGMWRR
jgi:hypothetical protein